MQHPTQKRPADAEFKRTFLSDSKYEFAGKYSQNLPVNTHPIQQQDVSVISYAAADQAHIQQQRQQQAQQREYFTDQQHSYLAAGDGNVQALKAKYSTDNKDCRPKKSHIRSDRNRNAGETFDESSPSSARSDSTRRTAIEQSKKGRQLLKLTNSRASLMKTVEEGIKASAQDRCCCNKLSSGNHGRQLLAKDADNSGSEDSNPCSSPSAGVINDKIINPMVKKFRLLYLHNIKEEVSIMEDLEMLPHKLDQVCRKMDKD